MQRLYHLPLLLALLVCSARLSAQLDKREWQWGLTGGFTNARYNQNSGNFSFLVEGRRTVKQRRPLGYSFGYEASYQFEKLLQLHGGLSLSSMENLATVNSVSTFLGGTNISDETIDQRYVLLELPLFLRFHLRSARNWKHPANLFLDAGQVLLVPIVNESRYQRWDSGVEKESKNLGIKPTAWTAGVGIAIGIEHAITGRLALVNNELSRATFFYQLKYTYFWRGKKLRKAVPTE